jgi:hypothetical protein
MPTTTFYTKKLAHIAHLAKPGLWEMRPESTCYNGDQLTELGEITISVYMLLRKIRAGARPAGWEWQVTSLIRRWEEIINDSWAQATVGEKSLEINRCLQRLASLGGGQAMLLQMHVV